MSLEKFIDDQVAKAIAAGEFDNLQGKGKPLDLDWYFKLPEDLRLAYSALRNAGFPPEETHLLKEIESLKKQFETCGSDEQKTRLRKTIAEKQLSLDLLFDNRRRR